MSAGTCGRVLPLVGRRGNNESEGHDRKKSTPERSWNSIAQGPRRRVKGHDRLVNIVHRAALIRPEGVA